MDEAETYRRREQTAAKHFILQSYLETLAYKVLLGWRDYPLAYVDAFSGPWESRAGGFSDTSFMIAIRKLQSVREALRSERGMRCPVRCFFVEKDPNAYKQLEAAVSPFNDPTDGFEIRTFNGRFTDAIPNIMRYIGERSFSLTFIDPTGWTGYEFEACAPLLTRAPGEVLLNYMDSFVRRFISDDRHHIRATFNGILGGPDWYQRLDPTLPRHEAVEAMFLNELKSAGRFKHVVSTPIMKVEDRKCFSIVYGTRSVRGLEAYRDVESKALAGHDMRINEARTSERIERTGQADIFASAGVILPNSRDLEIQIERAKARSWLEARLSSGFEGAFAGLWPQMLERYAVRKTDAKDICADLVKENIIENTWKKHRRRKPDDVDIIKNI